MTFQFRLWTAGGQPHPRAGTRLRCREAGWAINRPRARFLAKLPCLKTFAAIALSFVLTTVALVFLVNIIQGAPSVWPFVLLCVVVAVVTNKAASWLVGKVFKGPDRM